MEVYQHLLVKNQNHEHQREGDIPQGVQTRQGSAFTRGRPMIVDVQGKGRLREFVDMRSRDGFPHGMNTFLNLDSFFKFAC